MEHGSFTSTYSGGRGEADTDVDGSRRPGSLNPNVMRDNMHDWVLANERMAKVLAAKGYHYQFCLHAMPGTWIGQ